MEHEVFIPFPAETLREALRDHARVARCVPGLQQDADESARPLSGRLKVRVGGHTITYRGALTLTERSGAFTAKGEGAEVRGTGSATLNVRIGLRETAGGTTVSFTATSTSEGRLSEIDPTTSESAARRLLDRFATGLGKPSGAGGAGGVGAAGGAAGQAGDVPAAGPDESGTRAPGGGSEHDVAGAGTGGAAGANGGAAGSAAESAEPDASGASGRAGGVAARDGDVPASDADESGTRAPGAGSDQDVAGAGGRDGGAASPEADESGGRTPEVGPAAGAGPGSSDRDVPASGADAGVEPDASGRAANAPAGVGEPGGSGRDVAASGATSGAESDASGDSGRGADAADPDVSVSAVDGDTGDAAAAPDAAAPGDNDDDVPVSDAAASAPQDPKTAPGAGAGSGSGGPDRPDGSPEDPVDPDHPDVPDSGSFDAPVPPSALDASAGFGVTASGDGDFLVPLDPPAEAAHARRTMIGRSAEEVDHAPPRGRYAPEQVPDAGGAGAALRWVAPAAALAIAGAVVVGRALRRRR